MIAIVSSEPFNYIAGPRLSLICAFTHLFIRVGYLPRRCSPQACWNQAPINVSRTTGTYYTCLEATLPQAPHCCLRLAMAGISVPQLCQFTRRLIRKKVGWASPDSGTPLPHYLLLDIQLSVRTNCRWPRSVDFVQAPAGSRC